MAQALQISPVPRVNQAPIGGLSCAHCGLPVPAARFDAERREQFCCDGCCSVYAILHSAGLEAYYGARADAGAAATAARTSKRKFEELDDAAFRARHCEALSPAVLATDFVLEGVHCSACVWLVERLGRVVPAVLEARFDLGRSTLRVSWEKDACSLSEIARALDSLGYCPHPAHAAALAAEQRKGDRALLLRLGIAGAAAGNVMLMALALYSGRFAGMGAEYIALFRYGSFLIATPTVFWAGAVFFRGALAALRTRTPHMDLPVSIGILTGYLGSAVNTLRGTGEVYFDSLCTLIFLLLVGRYLQRTHQRRSARASDLLSALAPSTARLLENGAPREIPAERVACGDIVEVRAGERIAVDGVVVAGRSAVDNSWLTGESLPLEVSIGERVHAGTTNLSGPLEVRVEASGASTRLGRLMQSVETAQRERAPIVRLADRVAGQFVLVILAVAALTLLLWLWLDSAHAVDHTVALLVVTCPCALGMATPLAVSAALRKAAQAGVLFKGGEFVEALSEPGIIVFDKTGTLTEGRLELVSWLGDEAARAFARAAEASSGHPIALAFQRAFPPNDLECESRAELSGGLRARVQGQEVLIGSLSLVQREIARVPGWVRHAVQCHAEGGRTPVLVAMDGEVRAVAAFADRVRSDAARSLDRLTALGFRFRVLSGDHQRVVDSVVKQLGKPIEAALGGITPEGKLDAVTRLRAAGARVFMVGDGVNDASAMAAADVGIAVHGGAEASLSAADAFTTRPGLSTIALAAEGARRTMRVIRRGIALSLGYNLVGIGLAVTGHLDPLVAAILMPLSSITVVTVALRARTFEDPHS